MGKLWLGGDEAEKGHEGMVEQKCEMETFLSGITPLGGRAEWKKHLHQ